MGNSGYIDGAARVVNDIDDSIVTHANAPFLVAAFEFFTAGRTGN